VIALLAIVGRYAEWVAEPAKQLATARRCRCEQQLGWAKNRAPKARLIFLTCGATAA
jgi:hypothetical protein